ncbi:MAG: ATP-binding protein, partial [Cyanobacteria bacterium P01_A01_bin.135]
ASHDLKAPLRSIRNLSEWLKEDIGSTIPPENQQQLTLIIERIDRMDALLNALLNYARAGRSHQSREWLDTKALLREIIDILSPPQEIAIHLSPSLPRVWGSRLALTQVFINLISNAIKYGCVDQRGKITISAQEQPDCYEFTVADKGPGIAPSHHDRIFGIFERLQNPNESTGTGIGLAIIKRIVETEGGSVRIESSPGTGSAFIFTWRKS